MSKKTQETQKDVLVGNDKPLITVGTEIERYKIVPDETQKKAYRAQLDKSIKAHAIHSLELKKIFPQEASETASLCVIKKNSVPFMEVLFDDNVEMTQLEFISIPHQDHSTSQYTGGVKSLEEFFTLENVQDISKAIEEFPEAVKALKKNQSYSGQEFTFEFPGYSKSLFMAQNINLDDTNPELAVHVTHSLPVNSNTDYIQGLNTFLSTQRQVTSVSFRAGVPVMEPQLEVWKREFPNTPLDQTFPPHTRHNWSTHDRNVYAPLFKMPRDHLYDDSRKRNVYIQKVIDGEVLAPTSNLVEYTINEIKIYSELLETIQIKIQEEKAKESSSKGKQIDQIESIISNMEAAPLVQLELSQSKLEQTIVGLKEQVVESVKAVKPRLIKYSSNVDTDYANLAKLNTPQNNPLANISIFDSFDEKLKQVGLCEHRTQGIQKDFSELIHYRQQKKPTLGKIQDLNTYITQQCSKIIGDFKLLKDALAIAAKTTRETTVEAVTQSKEEENPSQKTPSRKRKQINVENNTTEEVTQRAQNIRQKLEAQLKTYRPKKYAFENSKKARSAVKSFKESINISAELQKQSKEIGQNIISEYNSQQQKRKYNTPPLLPNKKARKGQLPFK